MGLEDGIAFAGAWGEQGYTLVLGSVRNCSSAGHVLDFCRSRVTISRSPGAKRKGPRVAE